MVSSSETEPEECDYCGGICVDDGPEPALRVWVVYQSDKVSPESFPYAYYMTHESATKNCDEVAASQVGKHWNFHVEEVLVYA